MEEGWDILSPERSFTNIWKFCGGFEVVEDEDEVEEDRERTMLTLFALFCVTKDCLLEDRYSEVVSNLLE